MRDHVSGQLRCSNGLVCERRLCAACFLVAAEGHVVSREEMEVHCRAYERTWDTNDAHIECFIKIKKKKRKTSTLSCFDLGLETFQISDFKKVF